MESGISGIINRKHILSMGTIPQGSAKWPLDFYDGKRVEEKGGYPNFKEKKLKAWNVGHPS